MTLNRIGPEAADATPALIDVTQHDKDSRVRLNAALALVEIGPGAKNAVPTLIESLKDEKLGLEGRWQAGEALAKMGPEAKDAIPTLIDLIQKGDWAMRATAPGILEKISPEAAENLALPFLGASTLGLMAAPLANGPFLAVSAAIARRAEKRAVK